MLTAPLPSTAHLQQRAPYPILDQTHTPPHPHSPACCKSLPTGLSLALLPSDPSSSYPRDGCVLTKICQVTPLLKALKLLLSKHLTLASKALPPDTESPQLFSSTAWDLLSCVLVPPCLLCLAESSGPSSREVLPGHSEGWPWAASPSS